MKLIHPVEHRRFGVAAHPNAPHLVNVEARITVIVAEPDIGETRFRKHLGHLLLVVFHHFLVVVVVSDGDFELRNAKRVFQCRIEGHIICFFGNGFAHHV